MGVLKGHVSGNVGVRLATSVSSDWSVLCRHCVMLISRLLPMQDKSGAKGQNRKQAATSACSKATKHGVKLDETKQANKTNRNRT